MPKLQPFRRIFSLLFCALAGLCSIAWSGEPRIAVSKTPLSLPFYVAQEKNLFASHKVKPVLIECLGGNRCVKEMVEGRADMATASELPFMFEVFEGKPVTLISTFANNKDDLKFVVRKEAIKSGVKALVGKRIGFVKHTASHYYMDLMLLYYGIDPQSVVAVPMPPEAFALALSKGEVDAVSSWEPWAYAARGLGGSAVTVLDSPKLYSQTFNLLASNDYRLAQQRKVIGVLGALDDAIQFIRKNPEEARQILARDVGMDPEVIKAVWPHYQFELSLQQSLLTTLQGQARWARREGHVNSSLADPEFLNFIDPDLLRKIRPNAVDFVYP